MTDKEKSERSRRQRKRLVILTGGSLALAVYASVILPQPVNIIISGAFLGLIAVAMFKKYRYDRRNAQT